MIKNIKKSIENFKERWKDMNFLSRPAHILVGLLFFIIPFEMLVIESFSYGLFDAEFVFFLYILSIIVAIIAREFKLALVALLGGFIVLFITYFTADALCYYLKKFFDIDISHRDACLTKLYKFIA
ncbi:MAG: hypothetical protein SPI59_05020 [Finegoldia sp.]|nr:hypothetical protein [Finegoldia sp.]